MKTKTTIFTFILGLFVLIPFFSCDNPISLGSRLDVYGPVVEITDPPARKSVVQQFILAGTVSDYSGVDRMVIKATTRDPQTGTPSQIARQWRWVQGVWEISEDNGTTWNLFTDVDFSALQDGTDMKSPDWGDGLGGTGTAKSAVWSVPIDLGIGATDGEYTFSVQSWDIAGYSDDNSYKARVFIVDHSPPKVIVSDPMLYAAGDTTLATYSGFSDTGPQKEDPQYLGKFMTQEFDLKWQIEDDNDLRSFDLRFYPSNVTIDNNALTPLPDNYIWKFSQNLPENSDVLIGFNGTVSVPNLTGPASSGTVPATPSYPAGNWELKNPITVKTTIQVVAVAYDVAGNSTGFTTVTPTQEKTLGSFVYWPKANNAWIAFPDGMKAPTDYLVGTSGAVFQGSQLTAIDPYVFTVYPGKNSEGKKNTIKSTAYQAHGVGKVKYTLYRCDTPGNPATLNANALSMQGTGEITVLNTPNKNGIYERIFPWEFDVPDLPGYYVVEVLPFSSKPLPITKDNGGTPREGAMYKMLFRVNDITFPTFSVPPEPAASEPLFKAISNTNSITISGRVTDANKVDSLCMVWINPQSTGYAAMNQLAYFRSGEFEGWTTALGHTPGTAPLDENSIEIKQNVPAGNRNPNKVWRLALTELPGVGSENGPEAERGRKVYTFSQTIPLSLLNIGSGAQPLNSQVFLFRAENPSNRCTIITYAPQGDTSAPKLDIEEVRTSNHPRPLTPTQYSAIEKFNENGGDTIVINGTWEEDSLVNSNLNIGTYFTNNLKVTVNNTLLKGAVTVSRASSTATTGTWTITATTIKSGTETGNQVLVEKLKDTLVISAEVKDIGGNIGDTGSSWLIQSDTLRLMRISSVLDDATYTSKTAANGDQIIEFFLEFNKPVTLTNAGSNPTLLLNSTDGSTTVARATYKGGQNTQNSRQYFVYTVGANHNAPWQNTANPPAANRTSLNVTGLDTTIAITAANYPFRWSRGSGDDYEEVRLTGTAGNNGLTKPNGYYVRTLPTTTVTTDPDYQFTLVAGKNLVIDTAAPRVTGIKATSATGYYNTGDIYMTVTFSKPVVVTGAPQLNLAITNGANTSRVTSATATDVRVSENEVTFKYSIQTNDTTNGVVVSVTGYSNANGTIKDLAGNLLPYTNATNNAISTYTGAKTLDGIYIETRQPGVPTVRLLETNTTANNANAIRNNVNGTDRTAEIVGTAATVNLSTIYTNALFLAIQGNTTGDNATYPYRVNVLEYLVDSVGAPAAGTSGVRAGNLVNTPFELTKTGTYNIRARQIDKAGNVSDWTNPMTFTWDPGNLVTRISSENANGTYTNGAGRNTIALTVYFRKDLYFTGTGTITLNVRTNTATPATYATVTATPGGGNLNSVTFTYTIPTPTTNTNGHYTPVTNPITYLDVTSASITGLTAYDSNVVATRVNVSNKLILPTTTPKLDSSKKFTVVTGLLQTNGNPNFIANANGGTGYNDEANANFHGIRTDDGSYWTTLEIPFNRAISKGTGSISIKQIAGTGATAYRIPAVLTEAQYNRFKSVSLIDNYYTKGTNGYINGTGSDTSTKYVLQYTYNPNSEVTGWGTAVPGSFSEAFRTAESISIPVNAAAVTISGNNVRVRLSGSNAPQVPGASYEVTYSAGLVVDELGNTCTAGTYTGTNAITLRGVAKPFVRVRKLQDTIQNNTASMTTPRLTATQPMLAYARIDCRTPASTITYNANEGRTNVTAMNWTPGGAINDTNTAVTTRPANANGTGSYGGGTYGNTQLTLASGDTVNSAQGYQWWVRTRATTTAAADNTSLESEEIAYRTVITYLLGYNNGAITTENDGQSILESGDQIWIRGGDAIGSSSVPGFPFTWEDKWENLDGKRAGIRLMTKTNDVNLNNQSIWKFVSWEINTTAYVDFIRGHDLTEGTFTASSNNVAWQYGPKRFSYQRAGWTSYKDSFPIYPGKHRYCDTNANHMNKGRINFSGTFSARPDSTNSNNGTFPGGVNSQ